MAACKDEVTCMRLIQDIRFFPEVKSIDIFLYNLEIKNMPMETHSPGSTQ